MHKVLIIGIDGGTWTVLQPALERGYMPFLKTLADSGASGVLKSTIPAITPAAWGSFQTGMNPGDNGVFDFYRWDKNRKTHHVVSSRDLALTIWDMAGRQGKKVGLLNVPMTYPPKPVNGYMITGIMTPSLDSPFTYPAGLGQELLSAVPAYQLVNREEAAAGSPHENFEDYVKQMASIAQTRAQAARFLLGKEAFDLCMVHFMTSDVLQHPLFCYLDESHPLYDAQKHRYILEHFYRPLDQALNNVYQTFSENFPGDCTTFVISDHGFQSHYQRFNLGLWCYRQGYLKLNTRAAKTPIIKKITRALRIGKLLGLILPSKTIADMERSLRLDIGLYDWNHSRVFCQGTSGEAFIYLLQEKKEQKNATAEEITQKLSALIDPDSGESIIERVYHKEELYHGRYLEPMPDLVVIPAAGYSLGSLFQEDSELCHTVNPREDIHMGKHHPDGILIAAGPLIQPQKNIEARLLDITPTILFGLGIPIRKDSDGQVLTNLFTEKFRSRRAVRFFDYESQQPASPDNDSVYSSADEKEIEKRLEDLGYL